MSTVLPISPYQEPYWTMHAAGIASPAHHVPVAARLRGPLDRDALAGALTALVARHEAFRVALARPDEAPHQRVLDPQPLVLAHIDLAAQPEPEAELARRLMIAHEAPFDLLGGQPVRAALYRLGSDEHALVLTAHHIVADAHAMVVAFRDLIALYEDRVLGRASSLPPPTLSYAGILELQRRALDGAALAKLAGYWQTRIDGWQPRIDLPTDHTRPRRRSHRTATASITMDASLSEAMTQLARRERVGGASILLGAWLAVLADRSDAEDVGVLSPLANRPRREHERLVGMFTNTVVLRAPVPRGGSFRDLLARLRTTSLLDLSHGALPVAWLERFVPAAKGLRRPRPEFADLVRFNLLPASPPLTTSDGLLEIEPLHANHGAAGEDLHLMLRPDGSGGALHYDPQLFDSTSARQLADELVACLERAVARPDEPLARTRARRPAPVTIAATFTAEPVAPYVAWWARGLGLRTELEFAPLGQVHQQLLAPGSALARASAAAVLVRCEDWLITQHGGPADPAALEAGVATFVAACERWAAGSAPLLVVACPSSPETSSQPAAAALLHAAERGLALALRELPGVTFVPADDLLARCGNAAWSDRHADAVAAVPYTPVMWAAIGTAIARWLYTLHRPPLKVVVVDADETLWSGVVAELGPEAVVVDPARQALQRRLLELEQRGVLLCIASKNDEADVLAVLDRHGDMLLRREHLAAWRIDWAPKPDNVAALAEALGLGLDAFVFLDDNPVECWAMREQLPEVLTLEVPKQPEALHRFLASGWGLDLAARPVTAEDRERTAQYRQNVAREAARRDASSLEAFLDALAVEVDVHAPSDDELERAAQLTQRTNQLNLRVQRRSVAELRAAATTSELRVVRVRDRFGDQGLVGVLEFTALGETLRVDTFLLSCRVLGRGVEARLLDALSTEARARGLASIDLPFVRTARNEPAWQLVSSLPGAQRREGEVLWTRVAPGVRPIVRPASGLDAPPTARARLGVAPSDLLQRAVGELAQADELVEIVAATRTRVGHSAGPPPETATERSIAQAWAEVLGTAPGRHDDLFENGDSLHAAELVARIRRDFDLQLDLAVAFEHPTLAGLAAAVDRMLAGELASASGSQRDADLALLDELEVASPRRTAGALLLTGATGTLGPALLAELLAADDRRVVCLVRAADEAAARRRLRSALADQRLSLDLDRVDVVVGDLEQPRLGLSEAAFEALADRVAVVVHNGARLDDLRPYAALRAANVEGTAWALRLAARSGARFHHVSTLAVIDARPGEHVDEGFDLARGVPKSGYNQSKWVAERLVTVAGRRGLAVTIHRPGLIAGHRRTGALLPGGGFARVLAGVVELASHPPTQGLGVPLVAADDCAAAIAAMVDQPDAAGRIYHLGPREHLQLERLFELVRASGRTLEPLPAEAWWALVEARGVAATFADLRLALESGAARVPRYDSHATHDLLERIGVRFSVLDVPTLAAWLDTLERAR